MAESHRVAGGDVLVLRVIEIFYAFLVSCASCCSIRVMAGGARAGVAARSFSTFFARWVRMASMIRGSSMQAITLTVPAQRSHTVMSILNTRLWVVLMAEAFSKYCWDARSYSDVMWWL